MNKTFAQMCNDAYLTAQASAHPFAPSRAQMEEALQPVALAVRRMENPGAFIRATFAPSGLMPLCVAIVKGL